MSHDCKHASKQLVWASEGAYGQIYEKRQLRDQCLDCGWLLGEQRAHALARSTTPEVDKIALKRCMDERERSLQRRSEERVLSYIEAREQENAAWWGRYSDHLASEKWQRIRKAIFERDGRICRGCLKRGATQVHHLTYRNVCEEFAFQLVSICDICHERFHAGKP
jgi:5-methylcytosine-specific restriction endonuclease McrA